MQHGSSPQVGLPADAMTPTGNQQQHPLQSIHLASVVLGWQTASHIPPSPVPASGAALDEPAAPPLPCEPPVPIEPPLPVAPAPESSPPVPDDVAPVPPASPPGVVSVLQPNPAVEEAPATTST
jgi:hypothetical protein